MVFGGDINVVRSPYERSLKGKLSSTMVEFYDFINSCSLIDPLLKGGRYTWSNMRVFQFCLALIVSLPPGKVIFRECIKLFSLR